MKNMGQHCRISGVLGVYNLSEIKIKNISVNWKQKVKLHAAESSLSNYLSNCSNFEINSCWRAFL